MYCEAIFRYIQVPVGETLKNDYVESTNYASSIIVISTRSNLPHDYCECLH
jgi:hypothetical protein